MKGEMKVFGDVTVITNDAVLNSLTREWEHDGKVQVYLSVLFPALSELSKKIFVDHLPGGKWDNVTTDPEIRQKSSSTAKHNKFSESVFGCLDQLLRKKPNISVLSSEAYIIMFTANKTKEWLSAKDDNEQKAIINEAMRNVCAVREKTRDRAETKDHLRRK